jgi:hypothetical protein
MAYDVQPFNPVTGQSHMNQITNDNVLISQSVAILVDGNNIERSIHAETSRPNTMLNFDTLVPA